jgi:hypothetical protein
MLPAEDSVSSIVPEVTGSPEGVSTWPVIVTVGIAIVDLGYGAT